MRRLNHKIIRRYAKALLLLAIEQDILEQANRDMQLIAETFSMENELKIILQSPIIHHSKKQKILSRLFEGKIHPFIMLYIMVISRKGRGALLEGIARQFEKEFKSHMGIEQVCVITAAPLDGELREKVLATARRFTNKTIEFQEKVDSTIIGGFILNIGEKHLDASLKRKLADLKRLFNLPT
ncbi:MAG TPA: ATP synthase F1 subunit delta [Bacteroidales bacterium]|nr:ATP synthase F1 subunit delta [Bacteroidales bacterium]